MSTQVEAPGEAVMAAVAETPRGELAKLPEDRRRAAPEDEFIRREGLRCSHIRRYEEVDESVVGVAGWTVT